MKQPGFTFLELLIALSLFVVGMVSVLNIFPVNQRYLAQSANTTQAAFLAQEKAEQIRSLDYDSLTVGTFETREAMGSSSSDPLNNFQREAIVSLIDSNRQSTATDVGLKKIDINVYWTERSVSRQFSLSTYVYNK